MIFLDHNATTPICPEALEAMCSAAQQCPGNPGSRHSAGRQARRLLEDRREEFASLVDANPDEVVFTSGGTESSNLAIHGLTAGRQGAIALPQGEHPASEEPVRRRIKEGCRRLTLPLDPQGHLVDEALDELDFSDVILAASLLAHNETGTIRDLNRLSEMCREQNIPFHVDAVQAVGKIPVSFHELGATTMSIGAHKFHGPRGIGVLLVKRRTRLIPLMRGGHQEHGLRPGTEPVALVAGMTAALRAWSQTQSNRTATLIQLRDRLQCRLSDLCSPVVINGDPDHRLPNTLHMAFPGCEADALLVAFDLEGICCSLGSACASGSTEPSPILLAMGLSPEVYNSSVRLSLGIQNTLQEMDEAATKISRVVHRLRSLSAPSSP